MIISENLIQTPSPDQRLCQFSGDTIRFILEVREDISGEGFVRTNLGHSKIMRREVIKKVEKGEVKFHLDWHDIKMEKIDKKRFEVGLPLTQVGHFEAKCYLLPEQKKDPIWPLGGNVHINVKPAISCGANTIYNAFVRLFGLSKHGTDWIKKFDLNPLDRAGFHVIPPSGTFRDLIEELDFIIYELGCRYIQLLPIFPVPTTFGRMGRFGSPYAVQDFYSVDPELAVFDPKKTPIEQFMELASEIHKRDGLVILDIPINHTGWGSIIHDVHPEWLKRTEQGEIEVPEVWGVRWADLTKLDYSNKEVWKYMADVFLKWCDRGVDGFRGDAGYMIPFEVWEYIISKVRESFPDTIFFLEGLGGDINITINLLNSTYDWAYSELFQNYTKEQIIPYVKFSSKVSSEDGVMVHFCETHDNNRLASVSKTYAKMRTGLCALLSHFGAFGFANGVEWFADEKINVHEITSLNWGNPENQIKFIKKLSAILKANKTFFPYATINFPEQIGDNSIVAIRKPEDNSCYLIVIVNLDCDKKNKISFKDSSIFNGIHYDLITGNEINISNTNGFYELYVNPGEVLCLTPNKQDLIEVDKIYFNNIVIPDICLKQKAKEKLYKFICYFNGLKHTKIDEKKELNLFLNNPYIYLKDNSRPKDSVIKWTFPDDIKRMVIVPPKHIVLFNCKHPFRLKLKQGKKIIFSDASIKDNKGEYFVLYLPDERLREHRVVDIHISVYDIEVIEKKSSILFLCDFSNLKIKTSFTRTEILKKCFTYLASNKRGALSYIPVWWGHLETKYNALLSGNLNPDSLDDRHIMFTRLRAWLVHQGYSEEIKKDLIQKFTFDYENHGTWDFYVPTGLGKHTHISIFLNLSDHENKVDITFKRHISKEDNEESDEVTLIFRPDLESRSHHHVTKAYLGPEEIFPKSVTVQKNGIIFHPSEKAKLYLKASKGEFVLEPEWQYMVYLPLEQERGLDPYTDLFSPGYFKISLMPGESVCVTGSINSEIISQDAQIKDIKKQYTYIEGLRYSMEKFAVYNKIDKDNYVQTVVAGFPWFLDWGRDSLIFSRAYIEDNRTDLAISILKYFGQYEEKGTLPNLIKKCTPLNRDTSDAPLWFGVVLGDLVEKLGLDVLKTETKNRTFEEILVSIGKNYINSTPNGIKVDPTTGLVYSPPHFTWMDTNYPACTPRQGYPIEIQALWYRCLTLLEKIDPKGNLCPIEDGWKGLRQKVENYVIGIYTNRNLGYLSDCLHTSGYMEAQYAQADDHLRPNQLLCITLGLIKDPEIQQSIIQATSCLIVPGGIRSLADKKFKFPLFSIPKHAIKDPYHPYQGRYVGDEDNSRKPAYHNGTAWTWLFPSFAEALLITFGKEHVDRCLSILGSSSIYVNSGCVGYIPEILDGDIPHMQRGCLAQAWGVSELYRVIKKLIKIKQNMELDHEKL